MGNQCGATPCDPYHVNLLISKTDIWIAVLVWQQQQGILTWDSVGYAMRLISVFIIFPVIVGIGLIRSRLWKL